MAVFVIVLGKTNSEVINRIKDAYPDYYELSDTTFLVSSDQISQNISKNIGIGENKLGVVFKLNKAYSGYFKRSLWEWLDQWEKLSGK